MSSGRRGIRSPIHTTSRTRLLNATEIEMVITMADRPTYSFISVSCMLLRISYFTFQRVGVRKLGLTHIPYLLLERHPWRIVDVRIVHAEEGCEET